MSECNETIMERLAAETGGTSYKAHKYTLDHAERPFIDYSEDRIVWERSGETTKHTGYVSLEALSRSLTPEHQVLAYFLDGSRRVFKVDDIAYGSKDKTKIYPVIAGQIGVACCKRVDKRLRKEKFMRELVLSVPNIVVDRRKGAIEALTCRLNECRVLRERNIEISAVLPYKTSKKEEEKFEDLGTACVQDRMIEREKEMVAQLVREEKLDQDHYLIKDGSLEYRSTEEERKNEEKRLIFKNNYRWVLGVSKNFNPEACRDSKGKTNPGYIANLPPFHRTPAACFHNNDISKDMEFAVWYVRIRDMQRTRTAFDGVLKIEKLLVTEDERNKGMSSDQIDFLTALIINERNPVCYGSDLRWANHIYPMFLTEQYAKSLYLSAESFLHLF